MDDFNSNTGIKLNSDQTKAISEGETVKVETTQTDGKFGKINSDEEFEMGEGWNGVVGQIENKTASIIVDSGDEVKERRVYAKDYNDPELRNAPSITLREAIKLSFPKEVTEKEGLLYYNDRPIFESAVMTYTDNDTVKMIEKQVNDKTGKFKDVNTIYDVKLEPKMNFTIKLTKKFYSGELTKEDQYDWHAVGISDGGVTGKTQYSSNTEMTTTSVCVLPKGIIEDQKEYYVSLYMKADGDTKATIELLSSNPEIQSPLASKEVNLNNKGYQRIDIPIKNLESKKFEYIYISYPAVIYPADIKVYWDDVSITEVSKFRRNL